MGTEVLQQYEQKSFVSGYGKLGDSAVKTVEAGASLIDSDGLLQGQQAVPILRTRLKSFVSGYGKLGDSTVKTVEAGASLIDQGASTG